MEILVTRQPVFDRRERLFGYDLSLRLTGVLGTTGEPLPEQRVADAFLGIGINRVAAGHRAFVTVDRSMLLGAVARLLPKDRVILQIAGRGGNDPELLQACEELVRDGYRLSVATNHPQEVSVDLLRLAEFVKIDVAAVDRAMLSDLVARLRGLKVRLLATRVRHRIERDLCINLGFDLFEGYRFAAPKTLTRRDVPVEHVHMFRLLKMVRDPSAADSEIEAILRCDVALAHKLLRLVRSATVGGREIGSIGHALRVLGRERLVIWLGLLLVTDGAHGGVRTELITLSLVRARMCELLANASGIPRAHGPLFLVGILSALDQLLETPMDVLADALDLSSDFRTALLRRDDYFGTVLRLVEAYEQGMWDHAGDLAGSIGVDMVSLSPLYLDSLAWANEQQRASGDVNPFAGHLSDRPESRAESVHNRRAARLR